MIDVLKDPVDLLGLDKCLHLLQLSCSYGTNSTHCHPATDTFFTYIENEGLFIYLGATTIAHAGNDWEINNLTLIDDIREAVAACCDIQAFEEFLQANDVQVNKANNGAYKYVNRLILAEWVKSPALALAKIKKLKTTKYFLNSQATA